MIAKHGFPLSLSLILNQHSSVSRRGSNTSIHSLLGHFRNQHGTGVVEVSGSREVNTSQLWQLNTTPPELNPSKKPHITTFIKNQKNSLKMASGGSVNLIATLNNSSLIVNSHRGRIADGVFNRRRSFHGKAVPICSSSALSKAVQFQSQPQSTKITATLTGKEARQRRPQNVDGDFFVDHTCIDCDTCRWMAPQVFTRIDEKSAVFSQPCCEGEKLQALQALLSCPTSSIHTEKPPHNILEVQKTFPLPINEQKIPGVYHCGYHSERSYGATSYFISHPNGNILVDSPRYTERLAHNIDVLGGARYMFLTHSDDVADHEKWSKRLNCERIIHSKEVDAYTADVEMKLDGFGPWNLGEDFELIHTPGHTEGSVCLFYKPLKILFSGDHLCKGESELSIGEQYNQFSVHVQLDSVQKLLNLEFEWMLPGHGRRIGFKDSQEKNSVLEAFLTMKRQRLKTSNSAVVA